MNPIRVVSEDNRWLVVLEDDSRWELTARTVMELSNEEYGDLLTFLTALPRRAKVEIQELKQYYFTREPEYANQAN